MAYRHKVRKDCTSIASGNKNVRESQATRSPNRSNDTEYDRYDFAVPWRGKTLQVAVFVGVENGRCVAYWFSNPDLPLDLHMAEIGKARIAV